MDTRVTLGPGEKIDIRYVEGQLVALTEPTFPPYYWNIISRDGSQRRAGEYARPIWGGNQYAPGWEERFPYARCNVPPFAVVLVFGNPTDDVPCSNLRPFSKETLSARNLSSQPLKAYLVFNDSTHYWVSGNVIYLDDPGGAKYVDSYAANVGSATFVITR